MRDPEGFAQAFADLAARMGGVDRVIAVAGIADGAGATMGSGDGAAGRRTIETNLIGMVTQVEQALQVFQVHGAGHLVLISSVAAARGLPREAAYCASKAGVTALGQALQAELRGSDIRVSIIEPGTVETDLVTDAPFRVDRATGVAAIVAAIDTERPHAVAPRWPWVPIVWAMRHLPDAVFRRFIT